MRPVAAFVVALVLSACSPKGGAPATAPGGLLEFGPRGGAPAQRPKPPPVEAKPAVPPRASNRAFEWTIQVRDDSGIHNYGPEAEKEVIPIPSASWHCTQNGLKTSFSAEGDYYEIRDITCMLKSGHGVGGRTLCSREPSGKVTEDTQVLGLSEGSTEMKIIVNCGEEDKTKHASTPSPAPRVVPAPDPTPVDVIIVPPKTLTL